MLKLKIYESTFILTPLLVTDSLTGTGCARKRINTKPTELVIHLHARLFSYMSNFFAHDTSKRKKNLKRPHLFYERCHGKCIVTSTAGKQYEKYFLFRWTASEMSDALQQ